MYGYSIESLHGMGYRLVGKTPLPVPWELKKALRTSFIGKAILYRDVADSTQRIALSIAEKTPGSHGMVIIAEQQKNGRGRMKRKWISPSGGLWMSIILEPEIPVRMITLLPFVAAIAASHAIRKCTGLGTKLKWPNDVMFSGKKLAGILLDVSSEADQINYAVIGIGINANIDHSYISGRIQKKSGEQKITSISSETGHEVNRLELAKVLLEELEEYFLELTHNDGKPIIEEWKKNTDMLGRKVSVMHGDKAMHQGTAIDIASDGSLVIRTEEGKTINIISGDVRVRY